MSKGASRSCHSLLPAAIDAAEDGEGVGGFLISGSEMRRVLIPIWREMSLDLSLGNFQE